MRYFLFSLVLFFSVAVFSQDYEKQWNKVYAFELEGKAKSASEEADKIYKKAKKDKNDEQIIKAFLYQSKFILSLEESGQSKVIQNLKNEIATSSEPNKSILNYIYAKSLQSYSNQNGYKHRNNTKTEILSNNFLEWHRDDFESEIEKLYLKSTENRNVLTKVTLKKYKELIDFGCFGKNTERTMYDFLMFERINFIEFYYYRYGDKVSDSLIKYTSLEPEFFVKTNFSEFKRNKTIEIFQELEGYYLENNQTEDLERVWLERLKYVDYSFANQDLLISFQTFFEKSKNPHYKYEALLYQARLYNKLANKTKYSDYNQKAMVLLDTIFKARKQTDVFLDGEVLRQQITQKQINFQLIQNLYEGENSRMYINYKNVDTLFGYFYKIENPFDYQTNKNTDSLIKNLISTQKPIKSVEYVFENKKDFLTYSTEVILPKLYIGQYVFVVGDDLKWKDYKDFSYSFSLTNVTNILFSNMRKDNKKHFRISHRKTGKPLQGAKITYGNQTETTDEFGETVFDVQKRKENSDNYINLEIVYNQDVYSERIYDYRYYRDDNDKEEEEDFSWNVSSEIYTDRAIYRPGQTLYYKGIVHQMKNNKHSVLSDVYVNVIFENTNYEKIENRRVKTNEFGSFSGEFIIPKNIPTGNLTVRIVEDEEVRLHTYNEKKDENQILYRVDNFSDASIRVKVEEYKRPTFEVVFDKIEKSFVVNDSISIIGKAKTFSGAVVSDAKVNYIIRRNSHYSKPNYRQNLYDNKQIDFGETTTDSQGNFTIKFKTIPDENAKSEGLPVFSFSVNAIVTDNQGEVQQKTTNVRTGFHNLSLSVIASDKVNAKDKLKIDVKSENLNGGFVQADITLKIFKIISFDKIVFERRFPTPEIQTISEKDFQKYFPYEPYQNNSEDKKNKEELVYQTTFNTKDKSSLVLEQIKNWNSGNYRIEVASVDALSKHEITAQKLFTLINENYNPEQKGEVFSFELVNDGTKGFLRYRLKTATDLLYVMMDTYDDKAKQIFKKVIEIKNGSALIDIPIQKVNSKTLKTFFFYNWENKPFSGEDSFEFPYKGNQLKTEVISMTNRLEPNSNQTWSFVVKDEKKGVSSEVLASMYDMSLDDFNVISWKRIHKTQSNYRSYINGFSSYGYNQIYSSVYFANFFNWKGRIIKKDNFNWFDYNFISTSISREYLTFLRKKGGTNLSLGYVTGIVFNEYDRPLENVIITVKGTDMTTVTDEEGWFYIKVKKGDVLVVSYAGMETKEIKTEDLNDKNRTISLKSDGLIQEVVKGYRIMSPRYMMDKGDSYGVELYNYLGFDDGNVVIDKTHSEVKVDSDDFNYFRGNVYIVGEPNAKFIQTLQGQAAGVTISSGLGQPGGTTTVKIRGTHSINGEMQPLYVIDGVLLTEEQFRELNANDLADVQILKDAAGTSIYGNRGANGVVVITTKKGLEELSKVQTRQNLKETAFFYPHITTDKNGNLSFNFTSPEVLTSWKFRMLSHTKDALSGYFESVVTTQKDLMIQPNMPRFVRETDTIVIKAKVSNLSNEIQNGMAMLQLTDVTTNENINIIENVKQFKTTSKSSETLSWKVVIPNGTQGLEYKITAKAGNFTDGEQSIIPVLPNRILVNESIPIWIRANSKKDFVFENLKNNDSKTLENNSFTLEYTSNPTWIAIGSLPYLMEYEHECAEQVFSKYYANVIASHILEQNPKIKEVFSKWSENPTSKLEQNEELKNILLSETPWIRNAQSEEEQKKNLSLLMDLQKIKSSSDLVLKKLEESQKSNGAFGWFTGSPDNSFITTHIATGFGHLKKMGVDSVYTNKFKNITQKMITYLDKNFGEKTNSEIQNRMIINPYNELHYLYARSFYPEYKTSDTLKLKINKRTEHYKENWLTLSLYEKGMLALVLHRNSDTKTAKKILEHFKESAVINTDFGMYWLENTNSPYWYKAPIETQTLLIEAFSEISPNDKNIEELKVWLIKQKQTKHWSTTKSTTLAVNALLLGKKDFVSIKDKTTFSVGKNKIKTKDNVTLFLSKSQQEQESGYIKLSWKGEEITKDFAEVSVENKSESVGFGGLYWSYFEELDNIKSSGSDLMKIEKELYLKKTNNKGNELVKITNQTKLKLGDLVTIRLVLKVSENMDFVHLKDMRASGFEPVDVLSKYEYKDGLSYYKSTKDVASHFFFDSISKGTYVLEYDVRVNNLGNFSNGITTLQSMYAPEYSSHTTSVRVLTED